MLTKKLTSYITVEFPNKSSANVEFAMENNENLEVSDFGLMWSLLAEMVENVFDDDLYDTLMQIDMANTQSENNTELVQQSDPLPAAASQNTDRQNETEENINNESITVQTDNENTTNVQETDPEMQHNAPSHPEFDNDFLEMTEADIQQFIDGNQNKNTLKKTVREVALVTKFLKLRNEQREIQNIPPPELDPLLANFLLTVRKQDGGEFEPSSLRSFVGSVDRKLKRQKYGHTIIVDKSCKDDSFRLTREALKAKQKQLKQQGKGNKPRRAQPLTDEEINLLYQRNVLGDSCPDSLLYTVWLNNCVHFGLRGVNEHYTLRWGDVTMHTSSDGTRYLELNERQTKTRTGENISDVREVAPKMYECAGDRNPLKYYEAYMSRRPAGFSNPEDPFYLSVRTIPLEDNRSDKWFLRQKVGERKLGSIVKTMKERGQLDQNKRLTNHSARKYLVQKLRKNHVQGTDIMQISGHKNVASVNNYSVMTDEQHKDISNILSDTVNSSAVAIRPTCTSGTNLPRRTSTVTAPLPSEPQLSAPQLPNPDEVLPSNFCSQTNMSNKISSMFYGATLHISTLNVYTHPAAADK